MSEKRLFVVSRIITDNVLVEAKNGTEALKIGEGLAADTWDHVHTKYRCRRKANRIMEKKYYATKTIEYLEEIIADSEEEAQKKAEQLSNTDWNTCEATIEVQEA